MSQALARLRERLRRWFFELPRFSIRDAVFVVFIFMFGVFVMGHGANAADLNVGDKLLGWFGAFLALIIDVLGRLVIIVVNVLIFFASYNDFLKAQAVEIGWPLMRDVVNMFFIVVLLVSAFSTIIGYKEFHYTKVLPRLLLMAVLINFSKTLIGLMIDFSQVLMLTFVNAFKQAAGGNFVTALKLDGATKLRETPASDLATYELTQLLGASVLAIVLLGVALTLVIIMTAFIAFRIVGLWLLLIMSPMAFFAWALPGKMQKAFSAFTDSFWSRLSTLLIAGPAMAFFLWLALAIAQGQKPFMETMGNNTELDNNAGSASFVSKVGTPSEIGTFIIAVVLMLQGVEFAVKQSAAISSSLGKFATAVSSGGGAAVHLARGAARVSGKLSKVGFEGVDRLADVRGKIGRAGLRVMPLGIGAETFAGMAGARGKREAARKARGEKIIGAATAGLSIEKRLEMEQLLTKSGNRSVARQAQISVANSLTAGPGRKALAKQEMEKLAKERPDLSEDARSVMAEGLAKRRAASEIGLGIKAAEDSGDDKTLERYGEALKKDPGLSIDWAALGGVASARPENIREFLKTKQAAAFADSGSAFALMSAIGALNADGSVNENSEGMLELRRGGGGDRLAFVNKHVSETSNESRAAQLKAMQKGASAEDIAAAENMRSYVGKDKNGQTLSVQLAQAAPQVKVEQKFVRNEEAIEAAQGRAARASAGSAEAAAARTDMVTSGANLTEAFNFNKNQGTFESVANRNEFNQAMDKLSEDLKNNSPKAMDVLSKLDIGTLAANPGAYNEARSAAMANVQLESLKTAYETALEQGNKELQSKISKLVDAFAKEGERIEAAAKKAKISSVELAAVSSNPRSAESVAIASRMKIAGIIAPNESAQAATKGWEIRDKYGAMRSGVGTRATAAVGRAATSAAGAVTGKYESVREGRRARKEEKFERGRQKMEDKALGKDNKT